MAVSGAGGRLTHTTKATEAAARGRPKLMERADLPRLRFPVGCGEKTIPHKKLLPCTMGTCVSTWGLCSGNKC